MRPIKWLAIGLLGMQSLAFADTNSECLNHLGGGMADVECYNGLASDIAERNKIVFGKLSKSIPKNNANAALLRGYMKHAEDGVKYCELARQAMNQWVTENDTPNMAQHHDYDVVYYRCKYRAHKSQEEYLKLLLNLEETGND